MKLVSLCLVGVNCNYKCESELNKKVFREFKTGELYPVCPEIMGGLPIPRPPAEIRYGNGLGVLIGKARVVDVNGRDVTQYFLDGAGYVLKLAKSLKIKEAILKSKSPSCGSGRIYDGSFSKRLISGDGVTAALLNKDGISVINEEDL